MDKKKVPQLRFQGFEGEWEYDVFSDITQRVSFISSAEKLPRIEYEDIIPDSGNLNKDIWKKESDKTGISFSQGDVLYGKLRPYLKNWLLPKFSGIAVGDFWVFRSEENNSTFVYNLIQTQRFQDVANQSSGSKMPRADWNLVSQAIFYKPEMNEQTQIGTLFQTLDTLLTTKKQKHKNLLQLKKAMLTKLFPQKGQTVPDVRFKGFEGEWEERKLEELLEPRRILMKQSAETPRLAFASGQGVIPLSERKSNNRDQLIADEHSKNYLLTEYNDIVYNPANLKYGAIDRNKYGRGVISPIYVTFDTTEIPQFIERIVTTETFRNKALKFEEGTVIKRQLVSPENLLSFSEMITTIREEQTLIGNYFQALDKRISLQEKEIKTLENLKKALLDKLFVS